VSTSPSIQKRALSHGNAAITTADPPAAPRQLAFSIPEVCRITGFGRTTIYAALRSGDLKARRYGRRTLVLEQDLLRFLNELPPFE
jgi:excisionase family DNA binding protein